MGVLSQVKSDCHYIMQQEQHCSDIIASTSARKRYGTIILVTWERVEVGTSWRPNKALQGQIKISTEKAR